MLRTLLTRILFEIQIKKNYKFAYLEVYLSMCIYRDTYENNIALKWRTFLYHQQDSEIFLCTYFQQQSSKPANLPTEKQMNYRAGGKRQLMLPYLHYVNDQPSCYHPQTGHQVRQQHLEADGPRGLGQEAVGRAGQAAGEAPQLLPLETKPQSQMGDHHG